MLERRYSDIVKRISRVGSISSIGKQDQEALASLDRHVRFGETKLVEIERCLPNEKRRVWYSMKEFQSSYNFEVSENWRQHAVNSKENDNWTWRGMEHIVSGTSKTDHVRNVVTEIVKYHKEQRSKGVASSNSKAAMEELRQYSRINTKHDRVVAEKLGGTDARAVNQKGHHKPNFMIQGTKSIVHAMKRSTTIHKATHLPSRHHDSRELRSRELHDGDETEHPKSSLRIWSSPRDMEKFFMRKIRRTVAKDDVITTES